MLYSSFSSTDKKGKTSWFTVLPLILIDISNFCDTEIVDILSRTADYKLVVNLKAPDRSRAKRSNTNDRNVTKTPTCLNKFRSSENGKSDSKITESM